MSEAEPKAQNELNGKKTALTIGAVVFLLAFGLRLLGIGWGLPSAQRAFSLHPDEPINILYSQQGIEPARLDFSPSFYNYGTLYLTATRVASDFATGYGGRGARTELLGPRVLSALAGSTCALLVALFFVRRGQVAAAWTSGLATASANGLVIHSRFATVDVLATALLLGGLIVAMNVTRWSQEERETIRAPLRLAGAAALIGAATACKYNMALGLAGVIVAAFSLPAKRRESAIALAFCTTAVVFLIGVPGVFTQTEKFLEDVKYELVHTATGHGLVFEATAPGFLYHIGNLILATGFLTLILGSIGLGIAAKEKERWAWVALAFAIPYFLLIGRAEVKFLRYVLPLVPILAMGLGVLVQRLYSHDRRRLLAGAAAILGVAGLGPGGLAASLQASAEMAGTDPRDAAGTYLQGVAADGTVGIATDPWFWTPTLYPEVPAPRSVGAPRYLRWMVEATNPRVLRYLPPNAIERTDFDPRLLSELRPDYVAMTTLEIAAAERFQGVSVEGNPVGQALKLRYAQFSRLLREGYDLDKTFGGARPPLVEDMEYVRPTVYVWKRKAP